MNGGVDKASHPGMCAICGNAIFVGDLIHLRVVENIQMANHLDCAAMEYRNELAAVSEQGRLRDALREILSLMNTPFAWKIGDIARAALGELEGDDPHVAVISPPEAQEILANPHATKGEIERAHGMTYEIPCEHRAAQPDSAEWWRSVAEQLGFRLSVKLRLLPSDVEGALIQVYGPASKTLSRARELAEVLTQAMRNRAEIDRRHI